MKPKIYYIYDIREALRQYSDDSDITDDYISFLIDDTRALLLRQKYNAPGSIIPLGIRQRLHFDVELSDDNVFISLDKVLRTADPIPKLVESFNFMNHFWVDSGSYNDIKFVYITPERFPFAGYNKWTRDVIYVTIGQDYRLYFKAANYKHRLIEQVRIYSIFENPKEAWEVSADYSNTETFEEDVTYPIDLDMWIQMKEIILKQLMVTLQIPQDENNNADEQ